jgi:hypothetical protein
MPEMRGELKHGDFIGPELRPVLEPTNAEIAANGAVHLKITNQRAL